jgi:purine catabolism regulator
VAALGFGVGLVFRSIPRALLEEARARDFPVFEVPFEVPFRDIIAFIDRSYLSDDFYSLKRTVALQNTLLGAMGETRPEQALVERVATIVGGAVLYRPGGAVLAEAGVVPAAAIWDQIAQREETQREVLQGGGGPALFQTDGSEVSATPILVEGEVRFWLALAGQSGSVNPVLVGPVIEVAERLLRLIDLARDVGMMEERVRRGELLNDLLDEQRAREVSPERLELFGFGKGPWRVALLAVEGSREEALRLVGNSAASTGTPHLLGLHHGCVALVLEGDGAPLEVWTANLAAAGIPVRAALGRAADAPPGLVESRCDARLAIDFLARTAAPAGRVLRFEDFELVDALLSAANPLELRARVDLVLDPLRDHPQLLETLVAYLSADQNVNAAAETLHVHPNSLRYRLGRVEELLGRSVRSPATLADLYVALRAETRFGSL